VNIQTVTDNLRNTISGKEQLLKDKTWLAESPYAGDIRRAADMAAVEYLKINIDELKRILQDVEQCIRPASVGGFERA